MPIEPKTIPPNTLRAHIVPGIDIDTDKHIRPAQIKRDWMDQIPQKYVYRCIPLLAANSMGWELLNPSSSDVTWDGGDLNSAKTVKTDNPGKFTASSHFGSGIVTWYVPFLFRTSPDLGLLVTGPANHEHRDAVPLEAFIRTDWLPFPFTMSWKLTAKNTAVTFVAGDVIARVMPFPIALLEDTKLEIAALADDPGFLQEVNEFGRARQANVAKQQTQAREAAISGKALTGEGVWNAQYVKARGTSEDGYQPHQTIFQCAKPIDIRNKN